MNDESLMQKPVSMGCLKCTVVPRNDEGQRGQTVRRRTWVDRIFDGAYIVVTPANRQFTMSRRDILKFKGFRESGYAHATSETAVSAYRAHCEDSGLPFVLVRHSTGRRRKALGQSPPHSTVRLELPLGRKLSPSGRVAVFAEIASHSPWGNHPRVSPTLAVSDVVRRYEADNVAKKLFRIAKSPIWLAGVEEIA